MELKEYFTKITKIPDLLESSIRTLAQNPYYLKIIDALDSIEGDQGIITRNVIGVSAGLVFIIFALSPIFSSISGFNHANNLEEALITLRKGSKEYDSIKTTSAGSSKAVIISSKTEALSKFENIMTSMGAPPKTLTVLDFKNTAPAKGITKTTIKIQLKKVSLRHVTKFISDVERSISGIKFDRLIMDTKGKNTGWMNVILTLSSSRSI